MFRTFLSSSVLNQGFFATKTSLAKKALPFLLEATNLAAQTFLSTYCLLRCEDKKNHHDSKQSEEPIKPIF